MSSFLDFLPLVGDAINFGSGIASNAMNRRTMREANAFNAAEAEKNRQFQSQEAQMARDWQEQQYNLYSSPSAMVRQYNEAGLNPALMYGQNLQGSTGSSPSPSGSAASGVAIPANVASLGNIVQNFLGLSKLKQEINESKSRENANNAAAGLSASQVTLNGFSSKKLEQEVENLKDQLKTEEERRALISAQKAVQDATAGKINQEAASIEADVIRKNAELDFMKENGYYPSNGVLDKVLSILLRKFGVNLETLLLPTPIGLYNSIQEDWDKLRNKK